MKLKRLPEDFQVEELTDLQPEGGPFALYRLTKRSMTTVEAIAGLANRWKLRRDQISFGGLKDKHAVTRQFVTIHKGPKRRLKQTSMEVEHLGQVNRPFTPKDIRGNRFRIVIRELIERTVNAALPVLAAMRRDGLPNYFDDQRFGSLGVSGQFVAKAWCRGEYDRALWLALAEPNAHDSPEDKQQKAILEKNWGDWQACQAALARGTRQTIAKFLADRPGDFRGAITKIDVDQRGLYVAAYQSFLWNKLLAAYVRHVCSPERLVSRELKADEIVFYRELTGEERSQLHEADVPLPAARTPLPEDGVLRMLAEQMMMSEGMPWKHLRIKYPRDTFFSKGSRPAVFVPEELQYDSAADEVYADRRKLVLEFTLPRGSYATMLVKRLQVEWESG